MVWIILIALFGYFYFYINATILLMPVPLLAAPCAVKILGRLGIIGANKKGNMVIWSIIWIVTTLLVALCVMNELLINWY
jgi:hypothetical protein